FSVIANVAMKKEAPLYSVKKASNVRVSPLGICFDALDYKDICLSIPAVYEADNVSIVLNALELISAKFKLKSEVIFASLKSVKIPARFSVIRQKPLVIIDGAHNPAAMAALINSVKALQNSKIHLVFASFKDKDVEKEFDLFALANAEVTLTTFDHTRARTEEDYLVHGYEYYRDYLEAIRVTIKKAKEDEVVLITGSLHFAMMVFEDFSRGVLS
ncbi:MAG TPA: cyanophycin synthetase, partial [Bacilli bacterium]|nr:cyanophycin synthetase [Bacilli bacterium]